MSFFLGVFRKVREVSLVGRLQGKLFATRQERIIYTSGEEKEKFPVIVKAKVIGPFGAAAQKENQLTKRSTNRPTNRLTDRAYKSG